MKFANETHTNGIVIKSMFLRSADMLIEDGEAVLDMDADGKWHRAGVSYDGISMVYSIDSKLVTVRYPKEPLSMKQFKDAMLPELWEEHVNPA